jgi:glycosyltransferase involved in cell wall biosynthesis
MVRVALLAPFTPPSVRGNAVTIDRIARGLIDRGVAVRVWDLSVAPEAAIELEVGEYRPTIVHAFHAYRTGPVGVRVARRVKAPLVVTITGTDANHDLVDPGRAAIVRCVLESASSITVFHESVRQRIAATSPGLGARILVIPQGVRLPREIQFDLDLRWRLPQDRVLFVFPAGIRPIKRPQLPLRPFDRLTARRPAVRLLYVGPILDPDEGDTLLRGLRTRPWARYLGIVPHREMWSVLDAADVVINASLSEGGMANSVLEAMASGRPVLASDIEGNRSLVEDGLTGLLFRSETEFEQCAERLVDDPGLRRALGTAGRARLARLGEPEDEIEKYLALYRRGSAVHQA